MKSGFPSALELNKKGEIETKGGLILVKFVPKDKKELPKLHVQVNLHYEDLNSNKF